MEIDWNVVSSLATAGSATMAGLAWWALTTQLRQGHENLSTSILREHERQFFYSEDFLQIRARTCQFLKEQIFPATPDPTIDELASADAEWMARSVLVRRQSGAQLTKDGWEVVDFFDSLAIYGDQGTVDVEMAFSKFFYYYNRYWFMLEPWIGNDRWHDGQVDYYRDIDIFWNEMVRYGEKNRGLKIATPRYSKADILKFLDEEIQECEAA